MIFDTRPINRQAPNRGMLRYIHKASEAEVQAWLWAELVRAGYCARMEVACHGHKARFDIAIFERNPNRSSPKTVMPVRVIEVKRYRKCNQKSLGMQCDGYYSQFGIPVDRVAGLSQARDYVARIKDILPLQLVDVAESPAKWFSEIGFEVTD